MKMNPDSRYEMPLGFGPSSFPDVSHYEQARFATIPFTTERTALAPLVPDVFELPEQPLVSVTTMNLKGVDWMAGRAYNIVNVTVGVTYRRGDASERGQYTVAVWETDTNAIVAGREFLGIPKLFGEIPDLARTDDGSSFTCREYDGLLVTGRVRALRPVEGERLERLREMLKSTVNFGWKYVPCINGPSDADYPVRHIQESDLIAAWTGRGEVVWGEPTQTEAPISARIVQTLRKLPVLGYAPALMGEARSRLLRGQTRRLPA